MVIPTYNDPRRVLQAIDSVRAQTVSHWEAMVIDDGSNPEAQQEIAAAITARADPRIKLFLSRKNRGPARARNLCIRLARARFIAFLDADDLWLPDKLAQQLAVMSQSAAAMSCTAYRNLDERTGASSLRVPPATITYAQLIRHNTIGCSTVVLDTAQLGKTYFPDIRMRQDFAHWLRLLRRPLEVVGLAAPLTTRRTYAGSLSANKLRAAYFTWRMYRDVEGLARLPTLQHFLHYMGAGVLRRLRPQSDRSR